MNKDIGNIYVKAGVLLTALVMILSTCTVAASIGQSIEQPVFCATPSGGHSQHSSSAGDTWLHFDSGENSDAIGLQNGGTFEAAIRLTPMELGAYNTWNLTKVKFYHNADSGSPSHSGKIKIYNAGTVNKPGALLAQQAYTVTGSDWHEISLSAPVVVDGSHDLWVSVEVTHAALEYPIGTDEGPAVDGKGDWVYAGSWMELQAANPDLDFNWNIQAKVSSGGSGGEDIIPPVTACALDGDLQGGVYVSDVTVTLSATDDNSGVNITMFKVDGGSYAIYTSPFVVSEDGAHTVSFYSVDNAGNQEAEQNSVFTIEHEQSPEDLIITIKSGQMPLYISAKIKNNGTTDLTDVKWSITVEGGFKISKGNFSNGTIDIAAGDEVTVRSGMVFGIGFGILKPLPTITVKAADVELKVSARIIGPLVYIHN